MTDLGTLTKTGGELKREKKRKERTLIQKRTSRYKH